MSLTSGAGISATSGSLTSVSIVPSNFKTRALTPYTFKFITSNPIQAGGSIQIVVPIEMAIGLL